ncbi:C2 family cysteine protease [Salinibacterium sp.]|uniref:C2 family cysteine protease n=1 Tax=Salinibacterium sp. TaxID=1915057 RepID=UPI00286C8004|nr:C2 family cysteine protease [Salinibacterium sp.]
MTSTPSTIHTRGVVDAEATGIKKPRQSSHSEESPLANTGVPNPYALAEIIANRSINWDQIGNRPALLEEIFQMPYTQLFDPANGSPLYVGRVQRTNGTVVRERPHLEDHTRTSRNDVDTDEVPDLSGVRTLAELASLLGVKALGDLRIRAALSTRTGTIVEFSETPRARAERLERLFDRRVLDILFPLEPGYHPDGFEWNDEGRFYNEATEFLDPVQGGVGDCYFIAALASVAWSMPSTIADKTRATGHDNQAFKHQVSFFGDAGWGSVEVTDRILTNGGGPTFARSSEAGEIWPAVYEKAYAKWRLGSSDDFPAIPSISGGDPSIAARALTGLQDYRNWHSSFTSPQILELIKTHCSSGRTTTPMVAWTHGGDSAEGRVAYTDANVVGGHAYSVLGWMRRYEPMRKSVVDPHILPGNTVPPIAWPSPGPQLLAPADVVDPGVHYATSLGLATSLEWQQLAVRPVDYVVIRNPWGYFEATGSSVVAGSHQAVDVDWWRSIPLGQGGVFAMEATAFHRYFAGTGGAH